MNNTVLVIEDDRLLLDGICTSLKEEGFRILSAEKGKPGLELFQNHYREIDVTILDIMLPDISGFEILKMMKELDEKTSVILLTARSDIYDKISGFSLGADDYLTKPFDIRELVLRINARIRGREVNSCNEADAIVSFGEISINFLEYKVFRNGIDLNLTKVEFELLKCLFHNKDRVVKREMLLEKLWDFSSDVRSRTIDMHISKLRRKLGDEPRAPRYIKTVLGIGYKLQCK